MKLSKNFTDKGLDYRAHVSYLNSDAENFVLKAIEKVNKLRFHKEDSKKRRRWKLWDKD